MLRYVTFAGHPLMLHSPDDDEWKDITFYFNATIIAVLFCCFYLLLYFANFHYCEIYHIAIFIIHARFNFIFLIFSI